MENSATPLEPYTNSENDQRFSMCLPIRPRHESRALWISTIELSLEESPSRSLGRFSCPIDRARIPYHRGVAIFMGLAKRFPDFIATENRFVPKRELLRRLVRDRDKSLLTDRSDSSIDRAIRLAGRESGVIERVALPLDAFDGPPRRRFENRAGNGFIGRANGMKVERRNARQRERFMRILKGNSGRRLSRLSISSCGVHVHGPRPSNLDI